MSFSNAERQKRWREKRSAILSDTETQISAASSRRVQNVPLDFIVKDRLRDEKLTAQDRRLAVQILLQSANPEYDSDLFSWVRNWASTHTPKRVLPT